MNVPELTIRAFTNDQQLLDKCFYANVYQLRGFKEEADQPVVIDVGAHAGFFTFAALALGAKKVYAIEPYFPNFLQLLKNTKIGEERTKYYNFGIYTGPCKMKFNHPTLQDGIFYDYSDIKLDEASDGDLNKVFGLENFLSSMVTEEAIDILKISMGYAELNILEELVCSKPIESICGESDETPERLEVFKNKMKEKGYNEFYISKNPDEEKYTFLLSKTDINKHFNVKKV